MSSKETTLCSRLKGKVAVITASTNGIGFEIAKRFAAEGASVLVSSRNEDNVLFAVKTLKDLGYNVDGCVCHVAKADDRKKLFMMAEEIFGGIDILVSNAAVNPAFGYILDCSESEWDKIFEVNVKAAFMLSKEVLPYLRKRNGGSIIYISSALAYQAYNVLHKEDYKNMSMSSIPMNRQSNPKEIAPTVAFLASDDASYITGENIVIGGGVTSRL